MTCDICGAELVVGGGPGEWCKGDPEFHKPIRYMALQDPFTPYFDPHISKTGEFIRHREDRKRLMKQNNLDYAPRPYGTGGTEF